jgi:hypothetical protein
LTKFLIEASIVHSFVFTLFIGLNQGEAHEESSVGIKRSVIAHIFYSFGGQCFIAKIFAAKTIYDSNGCSVAPATNGITG